MDSIAEYFAWKFLSRPTSSARLLVAALDLKIVRLLEEKQDPDSLGHLDLPLRIDDVLNPESIDELYEKVSKNILGQYINVFKNRHLKKSNDLKKYLYKYLHILQKHLEIISDFILDLNFVYIFNLMYDENLNDGILLRSFLLVIGKEHEELMKSIISYIEPGVLEFLLHNIKISVHEGDLHSYGLIQQMLPLNICDIFDDFMKIKVFLKFGHVNYFNENYLLQNIDNAWRDFFRESFRNVSPRTIETLSLKRLYLMMLLYRAFYESDSAYRNEMLSVVKQLWRALPDPFITSQEIMCTLGVLVPTDLPEYHIGIFRFLFEQEFGKCSPTPRSLRHLCRCAIRNAVSLNGKLPEGIGCLPIPAKVKSYLLLET